MPVQVNSTLFAMIIKVKKMLVWIIACLLDPLILWCFGWKRRVQIHKFNGITTCIYPVWEDPKNKGKYYKKSDAIKMCEERK